MDNDDGDITQVAPEILELSKDPAAWREARRQALRAKVFGHGAGANSNGPTSSAGHQQQQPSAAPPQQRQQEQAAVMAQLRQLKMRARNDDAPAEAPQQPERSSPERQHRPPQPQLTEPLSPNGNFLPPALREKLQRAAAAQQASQGGQQ
jgi:hypothetical protein